MNADARERLLRTLFQAIGFYLIGHAGLTEAGWANISGTAIALISTYFTYRASTSTADLFARLGRTALQGIGLFFVGRYGIDQVTWEALSGGLLALGTTGFTLWASRKATGDGIKIQANPMVVILAIGFAFMVGGCSFAPKSILDDPGFAKAVGKAAKATKTAAQKADEALDAICGNYQIVDAGFQLVALFAGDRISPAVRQSEAAAVDYLGDLCANRPKDAQAALEAAQKAYGVIVTIHDQFKS